MATATDIRTNPLDGGESSSADGRSGRAAGLQVAMVICLALLGLFLPARGTAAALVGAGAPILSAVVTGVWIFKVVLLVHAGLWLAGRLIRLSRGESAPLAEINLGPAQPATRVEQRVFIALLIVAAVLRLVGLNGGLWFDEIRTLVGYVRLPVGQIIATYDSQNQHVLYSLMGRAVVNVFGESVWALRLPAVILGIASLASVYWFGSMVASRRQALLATAILAFSYHHVWFSQNARGYTALLFWTMLSSGLLLRLLSARSVTSWKPILLYAIVMALAVFTHVTAVLIVAAHSLIWAALWWRGRHRVRGTVAWLPFAGFVLAGTFSLQLYAIVLPQFMNTLEKSGMPGVATDWKNPLWFIAETIRGLSQGIPGGLAAIAVALAVGLTGLVSYARQDRTVTAVMLLPGMVTAAAVFAMEHNLWPRFFFFCAGFAVLIAVRGMFAIAERVAGSRGPLLATAAVVVLIAGSALTVPRAWAPKQDFAGALAYVERERSPADAVVTVDLSTYPFAQYHQVDWLSAKSDAELKTIEDTHRRTWVLYTFPARLSAVQPEIWDRLQRNYSTAAEFPGTIGGGDIIVKVRQ